MIDVYKIYTINSNIPYYCDVKEKDYIFSFEETNDKGFYLNFYENDLLKLFEEFYSKYGIRIHRYGNDTFLNKEDLSKLIKFFSECKESNYLCNKYYNRFLPHLGENYNICLASD